MKKLSICCLIFYSITIGFVELKPAGETSSLGNIAEFQTNSTTTTLLMPKMTNVPTVKLNNGKDMPLIGLGTWRSDPRKVYNAVKYAIEIGYRHFDCAFIYGNEDEVGEAIKESIDNGIVKREDLFITSKLWNTFHKPELVPKGLKHSLRALKLDYLDLYLIHFPIGFKEGDDPFPRDDNRNVLISDADYLDTWKAMEELYEQGKVKSIGVSNFNHKQLERLIKNSKIKPVNNQVECHPHLNQTKLIEYCRQNEIVVTAYSPLGSPNNPYVKDDSPVLLENEQLKKIAESHSKTVAQVLIRYQIQREVVVIPKSVSPKRIKENFEVFDFKLSDDDMKIIDSLEHYRYFDMSGFGTHVTGHKYYPFGEEY